MNSMISIIVPVYNVERYLARCIDSILAQTYTNFELILVDDGSSDHCGILCDEYARKDIRVKVLHKENGGVSSARNAGLDIAQGDYIGFVDSDDWIEKDMYQILIKLSKQYDADVVECGFYTIKDDTQHSSTQNDFWNRYAVKEEDKKTTIEDCQIEMGDPLFALKRLQDSRSSCFVWNKLYKKILFCGLKFSHGKTHEDRIIMPKILLRSKKYLYAGISKYYYFFREDSTIRLQYKYSSIKNLDSLEAQETVFRFLQNNIKDQSILDKTEYGYFGELLHHYGMNMNKQFDPDQRYRKKISEKFLENYHGFMKNSLMTKKNKIWMLLIKLNRNVFELIYHIRLGILKDKNIL